MMTQIDITYPEGSGARRAARIEILEAQKFTIGGDGLVTILDGDSFEDDQINEQLGGLAGTGTRILVLFNLPHGVSFRARRDALMSLGAHDVMAATGTDDEFLTRVRALMHLSQPPRILIVEDDVEIGEWAVEVLTDAGMETSRVGTLAEARARFEAGSIDALVVDRGLPDGDGLNFIAQLRDLGIRTPALLFTALDTIEERIRGLETARADDYICKPVHELSLIHI